MVRIENLEPPFRTLEGADVSDVFIPKFAKSPWPTMSPGTYTQASGAKYTGQWHKDIDVNS